MKMKKTQIIAIFAVILILGAVLWISQYRLARPLDQTVNNPTESTAETEATEPSSQPDRETFGEISTGEALVLTGLANGTGNFPEDGSDEFVESVLSATFRNDGKTTLQYARVLVEIDGQTFTFDISTIPAGATVRAFALEKLPAPDVIPEVSARIQYSVWFDEEPTVDPERLQITIGDGMIFVKNISDEDITGEVSIFFKNVYSGVYWGGITYRVRIAGGIPAGQTSAGYASHVYKDQTEVMFVIYGGA